MNIKHYPSVCNFTKQELKKGLIIPTKLSLEVAYISGILAGDGSICIRPQKYEYMIKCVGKPRDEKEFYQKVIKPIFKNLFAINLDIRYHDTNTTYEFRLYSKTLVTYFTEFIELPLGKKFNKLRIPKLMYSNQTLLNSFVRGVFDTDGCITFKKRNKSNPYYPVISLTSKSKLFVKDIAKILRNRDFKIYELYDYKMKDPRVPKGHTLINRIDLSGKSNLTKWMKEIGFSNPKHLKKIQNHYYKQIA